jgi:cell division protein FtsQ
VARRRRVARARGRRRRSGALFVVVTAAAVVGLYWLLTGPLLAIQGVSLSGYDRDDRTELARALQDAADRGTVLSPPVGPLQAAAHRFPWVESISVARDWPRGLAIRVVEATPVAVAASREGAVLVSERGRVLGPVTENAGVGWLRLPESPPPVGESLPDGARAALEFVAAADAEVGRRVRALQIDRSGALVGRLTHGPELRLGAPERLPAKARALGLVLAALPADEQEAASYIDLTVPENPAVGGDYVSTTD